VPVHGRAQGRTVICLVVPLSRKIQVENVQNAVAQAPGPFHDADIEWEGHCVYCSLGLLPKVRGSEQQAIVDAIKPVGHRVSLG
jgi:hypothetical protein